MGLANELVNMLLNIWINSLGIGREKRIDGCVLMDNYIATIYVNFKVSQLPPGLLALATATNRSHYLLISN